MNKDCFKKPNVTECLADVAAEACRDGFAKSLLTEGYSSCMSRAYVSAANHLAEWAARRGTVVADFDEDLLVSFVQHLSRCHCRPGKRADRKRVPFRVHRFLQYLREVGVVTTSMLEPTRSPLTNEYGAWMRDQRGLAASTICQAMRVIGALLCTVAADPARLDAATVRTFVLEHIQRHATASAGLVTSIVRCFLRWLVAQGRCSTDLTGAVPTVPTWRLVKLPNYLADSDVERIIDACDRPSGMAQRDRAMLLLLARLGLRASSGRMSRPAKTVTVGDQITTLLTGFLLTTAARELVSRFVEAEQQPALPLLLVAAHLRPRKSGRCSPRRSRLGSFSCFLLWKKARGVGGVGNRVLCGFPCRPRPLLRWCGDRCWRRLDRLG